MKIGELLIFIFKTYLNTNFFTICHSLYLNVITPLSHNSGKLPVVVFLHGGSFINGGSSWPTYNGVNWGKKNGYFFFNIFYF